MPCLRCDLGGRHGGSLDSERGQWQVGGGAWYGMGSKERRDYAAVVTAATLPLGRKATAGQSARASVEGLHVSSQTPAPLAQSWSSRVEPVRGGARQCQQTWVTSGHHRRALQ